jgi:hypothetical protein
MLLMLLVLQVNVDDLSVAVDLMLLPSFKLSPQSWSKSCISVTFDCLSRSCSLGNLLQGGVEGICTSKDHPFRGDYYGCCC